MQKALLLIQTFLFSVVLLSSAYAGDGKGGYSVPCNPPVVTLIATNNPCNGSTDGVITATVTGGTGGCTYSWSNNTSRSNATALASGAYTLTVTDGNGCSASSTAIVTSPAIISINISVTPATCYGLNNGSVSATPLGGTPSYSYTWSTGASAATADNSIISGLTAGNYTVTVIDANGCSISTSAAVTQPKVLKDSVFYTTSPTCANIYGSANVLMTGGTAPYLYSWSNGGTANTAGNLSSTNTYALTVTDANKCVFSTATTIDPISFPQVSLTASPAVCYGQNSGSITANVTGGQTPYTYSWSGDAGSSSTATNLLAGAYALTVTDANGCSSTYSTSVLQPATALSAQLKGTSSLLNSCNGTLTASAIGGTAPYSYLWSNSYMVPTLVGLCAGRYDVTVTDANGCTANAGQNLFFDSLTIQTPQPLAIYLNVQNTSAANACNGAVNPSVTGGTPPYKYLYSDQTSNANHANLCQGNYSLVVTDKNGLKDSTTFVISSPTTTYIDSSKKSLVLADSVINAVLINKALNKCALFTAALDSIRVHGYDVSGQDSVNVSWYLYTKAGLDSVRQSYGITAAGVYTVILQLYCGAPNGKLESAAGVLKGVGHVYIAPEFVFTGVNPIAAKDNNANTLVYPNPFSTALNLVFQQTGQYTLQVYDLTGRKVTDDKTGNNSSAGGTQLLYLDNLSAGTYLLHIITPTGIETHKLVKGL